MHIRLVFVSCLLLVVPKDAGAIRLKRFFWQLFGKPQYQIGSDGCPINAICMPGSKTCANVSDDTCGSLKCCKSFIGTNMCCMNLQSAGVPAATTSGTVETTPSSVKPGGGGSGDHPPVTQPAAPPAAGAETAAPPAGAEDATGTTVAGEATTAPPKV